ncbi:MAG: RecX family transcriptional regulator [Firmicutes bacterium]|nr:RecX family transcriptional regulator [Bacillota bacterium]
MRIDRLNTTPDRAGRYALYLSDGSVMRLYRQTVEDFALYSGRELTDEELSSLREAAGRMSAKMRAVRIVSASGVTKRDLEERLVHKGENPEQAKEAVQWMSDLNLLDDSRIAEQVVQRCISRGYGLARAKQALYEKKVPRQYWDAVLADYPDQMDNIMTFLSERLGEAYEQRELKRAIDALMRRGHSYAVIRKALTQLQLDQEDFLEE